MPRLELDHNCAPTFQVATFAETNESAYDDEINNNNNNNNNKEREDYDGREITIVPGMSAGELLEAHRKTLACFTTETENNKNNNNNNNKSNSGFHSLTLSRRNLQPVDLYKSCAIEGLSDSLAEYSFGGDNERKEVDLL